MAIDQPADDPVAPRGGEIGWYQHPGASRGHRFWDGVRWADRAPTPGPSSPTGGSSSARGPSGAVVAAELWWHPSTDRLVWSAEAAALHGYCVSPSEVDRELMLEHVVEADRAAVAACFARGRRRVDQLLSHHRMRRTDGTGRDVVMVAGLEGAGERASYHGFLVDLGPALARAASEAVLAARDGTAAVQRAVGVLGVVLGLDADVAVSVLRRASSDGNVKLRDLAQQVVDLGPTLLAEPGRAAGRVRRVLQEPRRPPRPSDPA